MVDDDRRDSDELVGYSATAPASMNAPATLDEVIAHLVAHREKYPEHGKYRVEVRERLVVRIPKMVTHDNHDRVVVLAGTKHHWGYGQA